MENQIKKCSSKEHENIDSISYCQECKVYMCNKCESFHSKLLQFHHSYNLNKNINEEIFTGLCTEENHNEQLEFFCKDHNILCSSSCLCKIKKKGKGQHTECNACIIEDIKEDKKNILDKNIKILEEASISLEKLISELKTLIEQVNENKEKLKLNIQKIFTTIRNELNQREDEILLEVDKKFSDFYFDDNIIKKAKKLPKKIKLSLNNGKKIAEEWNNEDKLNLLINNCINIEDSIKELNLVNEVKNKYNNFKDIKFKFDLEEENETNKFLEKIKLLGKLENDCEYFQNSLIIKNNKKYINNLLTWINSNKKITTKLLYRKSRDGDSYDIFHKLCDNQGATLVLIKSNEGFIIGGYTPLDWDNHTDNWKSDNDTFLFSLTNDKKYKKIKSNSYSIYCGKDQGPWYPCIGFREKGKKNMSQGELLYSRNYFEDYNKIIPNNGDKFFDVEEVEVYKISF